MRFFLILFCFIRFSTPSQALSPLCFSEEHAKRQLTEKKTKIIDWIKKPVKIKKEVPDRSHHYINELLTLWQQHGLFLHLRRFFGIHHFQPHDVFSTEYILPDGSRLKHVWLGTKNRFYRELFLINEIPIGYGAFEKTDLTVQLSFKLFKKLINRRVASIVFKNRLKSIYNFYESTITRFAVTEFQLKHHLLAPVLYRKHFFFAEQEVGAAYAFIAELFKEESLTTLQLELLQQLSHKTLYLTLDSAVKTRLIESLAGAQWAQRFLFSA